jgi:phosphatidylinositol glycan class V
MGDTSQLAHGHLARQLIPIFIAWKTTLLLLATISPGPGYDTSSLILLNSSTDRHVELQSSSLVDRLTLSTFRWDALYFVKSAQRGYVHEQEWAFSWAYSHILNSVAKCRSYSMKISTSNTDVVTVVSGNSNPSLQYYIWTGIAVSNICHLVSVLVLFRLLNVALGPKQNSRVPFIASVLHIMSPAALFLSSPYTEALFSALNFTGMLHYVRAKSTENSRRAWNITQDAYMLSSGVLFALATLARGNGLLSGVIYLYDVASFLPRILTLQLNRHEFRSLVITCIAGLILAMGYLGPQYLAYQEYCVRNNTSSGVRPWCNGTVPSIYTWVQSHYWCVYHS